MYNTYILLIPCKIDIYSNWVFERTFMAHGCNEYIIIHSRRKMSTLLSDINFLI